MNRLWNRNARNIGLTNPSILSLPIQDIYNDAPSLLEQKCNQIFLSPLKGSSDTSKANSMHGSNKKFKEKPLSASQNHKNRQSFKVMSFNILAPSLVDHKYNHLDQSIMNWNTRSFAIINEIVKILPDIVTLQEVDVCHFPFFVKELDKFGYTGVLEKKTGESMDGIATFWMEKRFYLHKQCRVELRSHGFMNKKQVSLFVLLEDKYSKSEFGDSSKVEESNSRTNGYNADYKEVNNLVGDQKYSRNESNYNRKSFADLGDFYIVVNVHLIFNTNRGDIKLGQVCILVNKLKEFLEESKEYINKKHEELIIQNNQKCVNTLLNNYKSDITNKGDDYSCECVENTSICDDSILHGQDYKKRKVTNNLDSESIKLNLENFRKSRNKIDMKEKCLKSNNKDDMSNNYNYESDVQSNNSSGFNIDESGLYELNNQNFLPSIIICGDMNYTSQSPLYAFFSGISVNFFALDKRKLSGQNLMIINKYKTCPGGQNNGSSSTWVQEFLSNTEFWKEKDISKTRWILDLFNTVDLKLLFEDEEYSKLKKLSEGKIRFINNQNNSGNTANNLHSLNMNESVIPELNMKMPLRLCSAYNTLQSDKNYSFAQDVEMNQDFLYENIRESRRTKAGLVQNYSTMDMGELDQKIESLSKLSRNYLYKYLHMFREPTYTAYHGWQAGCIDYIWYSPENLKLLGIMEMPSIVIAEQKDVPNSSWPLSDHFNLVSEFIRK